MMDIVVVGGGGHAKVIISILKKIKKYNIIGYTDIENKGKILGVDYIGDESIFLKNYKNIYATLGVGKLEINDIRKNIFLKYKNEGIYFPPVIANSAVINEDVSIGEGTVIMDGVVINSGTKIDKLAIINTNASIDHDCLIGEDTHIAPGVTLSGGVSIGNNCVIGVGSNIIQYIKIIDNVFIGAGSLVRKNITKKGLYVGNPLRKIK